MRYLVRAWVKDGCEKKLLKAIEEETLGQGSVAEGEYLRNMKGAQVYPDGTARWVEVCYCPTPLLEERPYWEEFFELSKVQDAHDRRKCCDENGSEMWACGDCDCTKKLEQRLTEQGTSFLKLLRTAGEPKP
jgi:hypothetical protein